MPVFKSHYVILTILGLSASCYCCLLERFCFYTYWAMQSDIEHILNNWASKNDLFYCLLNYVCTLERVTDTPSQTCWLTTLQTYTYVRMNLLHSQKKNFILIFIGWTKLYFEFLGLNSDYLKKIDRRQHEILRIALSFSLWPCNLATVTVAQTLKNN